MLAGANSPAGLASRPIRILLCDEVDRFQASAALEGDPVDLASKRTTTFWNYKIGLFSTPTIEGISRIDVEYMAGTQEEWTHKCPNCGEFHTLKQENMKGDIQENETKSKSAKRIVIVNSVKWQCPDCGFEFSEMEMKNAEQKYIAKNPTAINNGIRSFWLNAFSSPWIGWSDIMREFYEAKGFPEREKVVYNTRFGLSYRLTGEFKDENEFLKRRINYAAEVPEDVLILTAAVDVQGNRLEFEICGWSESEICYGIIKGVIFGKPTEKTTWEKLDKQLDCEFTRADGNKLKVSRTFIDSGYSPQVVYEFCRATLHKGRFAIKGKGGSGIPLLYRYTQPANAGGLILTILGVDDGKSQVMTRLGLEGGELSFQFPTDDNFINPRGYDEIYFKQLIAEHEVVRTSGGITRTAWETVQKGARNEALDLRVYNLAALKSCMQGQANFWEKRKSTVENRTVSEPKKITASNPASRSRVLDIY